MKQDLIITICAGTPMIINWVLYYSYVRIVRKYNKLADKYNKLIEEEMRLIKHFDFNKNAETKKLWREMYGEQILNQIGKTKKG